MASLQADTRRPSPADDDALIELLVRLLQDVDPTLADGLRRPRSEDSTATLTRLTASSVVRRVRADTVDVLTRSGSRAVCLLPSGRSVLVTAAGDGTWLVDPGGGVGPRLVRSAALGRLFPCEIVVAAAARPRGQASGSAVPPLPKMNVYLRLVAQLLGLSTPIAMMLVIDKVVSQGARNTLIALLAGVALLTVLQYLFLLCHALHASRESEAVALPVRRRVLSHLLGSKSAARWSSLGWDVIQGSTEGGRYVMETRPQTIADIVYVALLGVLMSAFSPLLLAVSVTFVPLYVTVEALVARRAERHAEGCATLRSRLSAEYHEAVGATELIRNLHLAGYVEGRWAELDGRLAAARYRLTLCRRLSALGVEFLQRLSLLAIMLLGVSAVIGGALTLGQYIAFNLLSMQLAQPVLRLTAQRRARADDRLQRRSLQQLEEQCSKAAWPDPGELCVPVNEALVLEADGLVLGERHGAGIDVVLRSGSWLGVAGASGCGKTTLLRALAGLQEPVRGRVALNGVALRRYAAAELSRNVRLVPQEAVVFSASIGENIRLGDPGAGPAQVLAAARLCGLDSLLEELPGHLNTPVGAAGRALSGGERQRIAIARAILSRPRVLLLDEATSGLDPASEGALLAGLRRSLPDAAVVVVSHRSSSLAGCGRILRLDDGIGADPPASRRPVMIGVS